MKNKEGSFLRIFVVLLIFVAAMGIIYFFFGEKPTEGEKAITIEVVDENEEKTVYGIYYDDEYNVSNVSANKSTVEGLVEKYNKYKLDPIHLHDVIEDFLEE